MAALAREAPHVVRAEGGRRAAVRDLDRRISPATASVEQIHWLRNSGAPPFEPVAGTEESHPAELVLLAMGFVGPEPALLDALGVARDARGNVETTEYATSVRGVFAAGDARRGQSLIVWAIEEGRRCASAVDAWLGQERPSGAASAGLRAVSA